MRTAPLSALALACAGCSAAPAPVLPSSTPAATSPTAAQTAIRAAAPAILAQNPDLPPPPPGWDWGQTGAGTAISAALVAGLNAYRNRSRKQALGDADADTRARDTEAELAKLTGLVQGALVGSSPPPPDPEPEGFEGLGPMANRVVGAGADPAANSISIEEVPGADSGAVLRTVEEGAPGA